MINTHEQELSVRVNNDRQMHLKQQKATAYPSVFSCRQ